MLGVVSEYWWKLNKHVTIPSYYQGMNVEVSEEAETDCWEADF